MTVQADFLKASGVAYSGPNCPAWVLVAAMVAQESEAYLKVVEPYVSVVSELVAY